MVKQESAEQATGELVLGRLRQRRRPLVPAVTGVVAIAIIAVAVGVATRPHGDRTRRITSMGDQVPGATVTAVPATTVPDAARPSPTAPPAAGPTPTTATAPSPAIAPDRTRPAGMNYTPEAVWPETLAELDRLQAAVDQGHQPWRNDPVEVARAYLLDRGLSGPTIGPFRATAQGAGSRTTPSPAWAGGSTSSVCSMAPSGTWPVPAAPPSQASSWTERAGPSSSWPTAVPTVC